MFVLNCAIRNGDAHLKNFGLVYDTRMALTLNGSTGWPNRKRLQQLGQARARLSPAAVTEVLDSVADALSDVSVQARAYFADSPHPKVGEAMLAAWDDGVRTSLGLDDRTSFLLSSGSAFTP